MRDDTEEEEEKEKADLHEMKAKEKESGERKEEEKVIINLLIWPIKLVNEFLCESCLST